MNIKEAMKTLKEIRAALSEDGFFAMPHQLGEAIKAIEVELVMKEVKPLFPNDDNITFERKHQ